MDYTWFFSDSIPQCVWSLTATPPKQKMCFSRRDCSVHGAHNLQAVASVTQPSKLIKTSRKIKWKQKVDYSNLLHARLEGSNRISSSCAPWAKRQVFALLGGWSVFCRSQWSLRRRPILIAESSAALLSTTLIRISFVFAQEFSRLFKAQLEHRSGFSLTSNGCHQVQLSSVANDLYLFILQ